MSHVLAVIIVIIVIILCVIVTDRSHGVVLTGTVLVLHRFCLHTDRAALCGRAGASSGILLRG